MGPVRRPNGKCPQGKLNSALLSLPTHHLHSWNELPQRLDNLPIANVADAAVVAANENGSVENSLGHNRVEGAGRPRSRIPPLTTCSSRMTVCKKLHRPPLRRRQHRCMLPFPPPRATAAARDAERRDGPQGCGDPRVRRPQQMEELLLRHRSHLLSARQTYCTSPQCRRKNPAHREDTDSVAIGRTSERRPEMPIHHLRHRHRPPAPSEDKHQPRPPTLSLHETIRTVQQLSSGKAPASDASSAEVCKHDCPKFMEHLTALFQEMWRQGEVAQDFKDTTIIHLYKRIGNRQVCDNHRGICLLNIAGKIFAHILLNRLKNHFDQSVLVKSQCGLRRYRGTMDRIFVIHQLQEKWSVRRCGPTCTLLLWIW
ncbi:hypothetical protein SprV_1002916600 [Sparganum proliferum]